MTVRTLAGVLLIAAQLSAQSLEPVFGAERAFAHQADQQGIRAAFLAWLAEDAKVFTPRMVSAKTQYGPEPGDPGHLSWYPEAMGMAASGDLAWSLGPWAYAPKKGGPVLVNGHFLSIWRKQADGQWKVEADIGVPHAAPEQPIECFAPREASLAAPATAQTIPDATAGLRQKEVGLSAAWARKGGLALLPELAREGRVLRPRSLPLQGEANIRKVLAADQAGARWQPAKLQVAPSGDLGWVCGECGPDDKGATASFLRVWIREAGAWKVLFDVRLPHPAVPK